MLSGPSVPVMVSVSFVTDADADAVGVAVPWRRSVDGAAPAAPAAPKLTANAAADARLN